MKDTLLQSVRDFLSKNHQGTKPLLLGISGGGDSLALLHLLLECKRFFSLDLHLAHFDHGWRQESAKEAESLKAAAKELGLPFHVQRGVCAEGGNLEDNAREQRMSFFMQIYKKVNAQALLLAHQREDQAETVLKRFFEGADLFSLGAMSPIDQRGDMIIWRPLLRSAREDLRKWLKEKGLQPFEDPTNRDSRFLRARMRQDLFPYIEKSFGKKIALNICRFAERVHLFKEVFEDKYQGYLKLCKSSRWAVWCDFRWFKDLHRFDYQGFLKYFFHHLQMVPNGELLQKMGDRIQEGAADQSFWVGGKEVLIDRKRLVVFLVSMPGEIDWIIEKNPIGEIPCESLDPWEYPLFGRFLCSASYVKKGEVCAFRNLDPHHQKEISSSVRSYKLPLRLKSLYPCLVDSNASVHHFFDVNKKCNNLKLHNESVVFSINFFNN